MQENQKQSIVLASILKPADDTRMLEKMAVSLAHTNKWNVHVIGVGSQTPSADPRITFHLHRSLRRISIKRIWQPWRVLGLLLKIKPGQVIITTHELLIPVLIYKLIKGVKVYYDIQENYKLNILNTNAFPLLLRPLVAIMVRVSERVTSPFINHFFLAEKTYADELPFINKKFTILENKALLPANFKRHLGVSGINLLFSGTLDQSTGVFEAISLSSRLKKEYENLSLTIIGYAARQKVRDEIRALVNQYPFVKIIGLDEPVPHNQILEAISRASAGIIYYPKSTHTANRVPTKLYEYLAAQLPIIYDATALWRALPEQWKAGVAVDLHSCDKKAIINALTTGNFYPSAPQNVCWETEAESLIRVLS